MQIFEHGLAEMRLRALGIKILVAQDQRAAGCNRALLRDPEGARVAQVQEAGGRGSQPAPIGAAAKVQNRSGMLEKAIRVGAAAPASSMLAKHRVLVPYL